MDENVIIIYGTNWCGDCLRSRRFLDLRGITYQFIDIDHDAAAEQFVIHTNRGNRSVPTIVFADGTTLTEPSNLTLAKKLGVKL
jgi:mycoredoxin